MKRKIAAILASDIAGYSRLVAEDEEATVQRLTAYLKTFGELVTSHDGRVVNTAGDAVLAEFPSSVEAVRCAIEIHESVHTRNASYPAGRAIMVRIGINVGDIVECDDGGLLGDGVNIAARLEQLAPPGTICVSRSVHEQIGNKVPVPFEDIGLQQLKNIANPIHAYVIHPLGRKDASGMRAARPRWQWRPRIGIAAGFAIAVISVAVGQQLIGRRPASVAPNAEPALAAATAVTPLDEARLRQRAADQNISLPKELKILPPAAPVARDLTRYLGAWGGDGRWNRGGRQAILVVESVDSNGTALGIYAHSPPLRPNEPKRPPGPFTSFVGTITDDGLSFAWGQSKYRFTLAPDDSMWGLWKFAGPQGSVDIAITLNRLR